MPKRMNLFGKKFGRLSVIKDGGRNKFGQILWGCKCECGNVVSVVAARLNSGHSKSCGCLQADVTAERSSVHGFASRKNKSVEYNTWCSMKSRCYNVNDKRYKDYGGRGIRVCARWVYSFSNFLKDVGLKPEGKTLDRFPNNNGDYKQSNYRWATPAEQARNRRTSKLTVTDAKFIRSSKLTSKDLSEKFKVGVNNINKIRQRKTFKDI